MRRLRVLFGISLYFLSRENVFSLIEEALDLGIRKFEVGLEIPHLDFIDDKFFERLEQYKSSGASFSLHAPWIECNLASLFPEIREFTRRRIMSSLDCAHIWGLNPVVLHPGFSFVRERGFHIKSKESYFAELERIFSYAKEKGITILLENVPFAFSFFSSLSETQEIKKYVDIDFCYDLGHSILLKRETSSLIEESILSEIASFKSEIKEIHFHNNHGKKDDHLLYEGIVDAERILLGLKEEDFDGIIMVESSDIEKFGLETFVSLLRRLELL